MCLSSSKQLLLFRSILYLDLLNFCYIIPLDVKRILNGYSSNTWSLSLISCINLSLCLKLFISRNCNLNWRFNLLGLGKNVVSSFVCVLCWIPLERYSYNMLKRYSYSSLVYFISFYPSLNWKNILYMDSGQLPLSIKWYVSLL